MPAAKKPLVLTVAKEEAIFNGEGGFLAVGDTFEAVDEDAAEQLKARGLAK